MSITVTLAGRITNEPELKYSGNGKPYTRFTIATDRRELNKTTNQWESKDSTFWNCTAFGPLAENIAESLAKGTAVIATGRASQEDWTDKQGNKRTSMKVVIDEIGPTLRFATVKVSKADGNGNGQQSQRSQAAAAQSGWGSGYSDTPPF